MTVHSSGVTHDIEAVATVPPDVDRTDGRASLALAAGIAAALVSGGIWAAVVLITKLEVGWVAWGVGLLVGGAMSRVTHMRTKQLAYYAAIYALIGLFVGKTIIFSGSAGVMAREIEKNSDLMTSSVAWQMYQTRELLQPTLAAVDAAVASGNELGDPLWTEMQAQATSKIATMTAEQKHEAAIATARGSLKNVGMLEGIRSQLSWFDLLWLFLAIGTAYRMMAPRRHAQT